MDRYRPSDTTPETPAGVHLPEGMGVDPAGMEMLREELQSLRQNAAETLQGELGGNEDGGKQ